MQKFRIRLFDWNSACTSYSAENRTIKMIHDGNIFLYNVSSDGYSEKISSWSIKNMKLGAHYKGVREFEGKITLFHVWDYVIDDFGDINLDDESLTGNLFDWNLAAINIHGSTYTENLDKIQSGNNSPEITLLPYHTSFAKAKIDCNRLGGRLVTFKDSKQIQRIQSLFEMQDVCKNYVWSLHTKNSNGLFLDDDNNNVQKENFEIGEPNGGKYEECLALKVNSGKLVDYGCKELLCPACDFQKLPIFNLRGNIPEIYKVDSEFYWIGLNQRNQQSYFEGSVYNKLIAEKQSWFLLNDDNETIFKLENREYPIGRYDWLEIKSSKTISISFDNCDDTQFNCGDGLCINKRKRCNQIQDCFDNSDEENCSHILLYEDYNKDVPPFENLDHEYSITISSFTLQIENIREQESIFDVNIRMESMWRDSRIKFKDLYLKDRTVLSKLDREKLWMPDYALWLTDDSGLVQDFSFQSLVADPSVAGNSSDVSVSIAHTEYDGGTVDLILGSIKVKLNHQ